MKPRELLRVVGVEKLMHRLRIPPKVFFVGRSGITPISPELTDREATSLDGH